MLTTPVVLRETPGWEVVAWSTDKGFLCVAKVDRNSGKTFDLLYSIRTDKPIVCSPAYVPPVDRDSSTAGGLIFAGSQDGYIYGIHENGGDVAWRFPTGSPILESPVALGPFVFVANEAGNLYCLNAKDGIEKWAGPAANVTRFLAASRGRVYAADPTGQVQVLDARRGTPLATIPLESAPLKLTNVESDRLYVASPTGLVQCLHESELAQPLSRRFAETIDPDLVPIDPSKAAKKEAPPISVAPAPPSSASSGSSTPRSTPKAAPKTSEKERTGKKAGDVFGGAGPYEQTPSKDKGGKNKQKGRESGGIPGGMGAMPGGMGGIPGGNR